MAVAHYKETTLLASAARTTTQTTADILVPSGGTPDAFEGVTVILDVTAVTGAASLTLSVDEYIPAKGGYSPILQSTAITTQSTNHLRIGPYMADVANKSRSQLCPRRFRVRVIAATADSATYSLDMNQWSLS